jgi:HTH-type transcriptional regulator, cell division transcriptional repressor
MLQKPKSLGARIQARREELGLSKAELARRAKVSDSAVGQWERGDTKNLKLDVLFAVADTLKITARELATGEPERPADLPADEIELLQKYRQASPRWKLSLRLLAEVRDNAQEEVSESINILMAKIFAKPVADRRVEEAYGKPPGRVLHQDTAPYGKKK